MTASDTWLEARGIDKRFGGVHALRGADFSIATGEIRGLVGPNGAGKSTLSGVISGSVVPDLGEVLIDGEPVHGISPAHMISRGIVIMPQKINLIADGDLVDNINLGREESFRFGNARQESRDQAITAGRRAGLRVPPSTRARDLSPVEQRLLMLARALVWSPRLLILDEPTAGLPREGAEVVQEVIRGLKDSVSVLYVSHHLSEIVALCDSVTCVREGRVAGELRGEEVTKERVIDLILGDTPELAAALHWREPFRPGAEGPALVMRGVSSDTLREVDADFHQGEVVGVTGLLGSGIDEFLGVIAGITKPTGGAIELEGERLHPSSPAAALRHGIGYLGEDRSLTSLQNLTIRENASLSSLRKLAGLGGFLTRAHERRGVDSRLADLSVTADPERAMSTLSGGNQQRVLMARLLTADLKVILITEPTVGVDIRARQELWDAVGVMSAGRVVIVASSEPEELMAMCDRVICLARGQVSAVLDSSELSERTITHAIA